jgi:hypothetical protein
MFRTGVKRAPIGIFGRGGGGARAAVAVAATTTCAAAIGLILPRKTRCRRIPGVACSRLVRVRLYALEEHAAVVGWHRAAIIVDVELTLRRGGVGARGIWRAARVDLGGHGERAPLLLRRRRAKEQAPVILAAMLTGTILMDEGTARNGRCRAHAGGKSAWIACVSAIERAHVGFSLETDASPIAGQSPAVGVDGGAAVGGARVGCTLGASGGGGEWAGGGRGWWEEGGEEEEEEENAENSAWHFPVKYGCYTVLY